MTRRIMKLRPGHPTGAMNILLNDGSVACLTAEPIDVDAELVPAEDLARLAKWVDVDDADAETGDEGDEKQMPNAETQRGKDAEGETPTIKEIITEEVDRAKAKQAAEAEAAEAAARVKAEKAAKAKAEKAAKAKAEKAAKAKAE